MRSNNIPNPAWLPLRQAIFRFGLAQAAAEPHVDLIGLPREKSGADHVKIGQTGPEPAFDFAWADGYCMGSPPWVILAEPVADQPSLDHSPNIRAATAKEQAVSAARCQAVRAATSRVWHQFMVRTFNRAVSASAVVLYARPKTVTADFVPVPAVWAILEVADWVNGVMVAPDSTAFFSIHAVAVDAHEKFENAGTEAPTLAPTPINATDDQIRVAMRAVYDGAGERPADRAAMPEPSPSLQPVEILPPSVNEILPPSGGR